MYWLHNNYYNEIQHIQITRKETQHNYRQNATLSIMADPCDAEVEDPREAEELKETENPKKEEDPKES